MSPDDETVVGSKLEKLSQNQSLRLIVFRFKILSDRIFTTIFTANPDIYPTKLYVLPPSTVKISGLVPVTCIWSSIFSSTFIVLALKRVNLPQKINCQSVSILSNKSHLFLSPLHSFIVTRFGEISPLLQNCNSLPFLKALFSVWQKFWTYFGDFLGAGQMSIFVNGKQLMNYKSIWSHCVTLSFERWICPHFCTFQQTLNL